MTKTKSIYSKLAALCAVLTIVIAASADPLTATASQGDDPFKNVNLRAEAQTVDRYCIDLDRFDKDLVVARRKTSLSHEEFNKLRDRASELKRRWSELQQAVRSAIAKLKAADRWANFDELILSRIGEARIRDFIRNNGGLKRALEEALVVNPDREPLFDIEKNLRPKVTFQGQDLRFDKEPLVSEFRLVPVAYNPAALKFGDGLLCLGAKIRKGLSKTFNDGTATDKASCMFTCRCISPDIGCTPCDGL